VDYEGYAVGGLDANSRLSAPNRLQRILHLVEAALRREDRDGPIISEAPFHQLGNLKKLSNIATFTPMFI